jgi:hypothetical protein
MNGSVGNWKKYDQFIGYRLVSGAVLLFFRQWVRLIGRFPLHRSNQCCKDVAAAPQSPLLIRFSQLHNFMDGF